MKKVCSISVLTFSVWCCANGVAAQQPSPTAIAAPPAKVVEETKRERLSTTEKSAGGATGEMKVEKASQSVTAESKTIPREATVSPTPPVDNPKTVTEAAKSLPQDVPDDTKASRRGQLSEEEAAVVPYYNNFMTSYFLGPEDVISVSVFNQPNYSKAGITVPPNGRISYPLIREGIFVAGKTVEQIADEVTKKLDEYIIDPKVQVSIDRAMSARYSVLGDVGKPGAQIMTRRLSVYEAIAEAGGILPTGNKKEVIVLRSGADGRPYPIPVNLKEIEKGKSVEMVFLVPGDQVIVQGNKIKAWQGLLKLMPIIGFARGVMSGGIF